MDHWQGAHTLVSREIQARLAEADAAAAAAAAAQAENAELVKRLVEMKDREIERMNEMNRMREEMVGSRGGWVGWGQEIAGFFGGGCFVKCPSAPVRGVAG